MKKIFIFTLTLLVAVVAFGQDSLAVDSVRAVSANSAAAHANFSAAKLEDATKAEGDSAYMKNDYTSAIHIYEALLNKGEAAEIYYNLGNSYYKTGEIAKAILNYERALLLQPGNGDIRTNLDVARSKTIDKVESVPEIFFVSWTKGLINSMSVDAWANCGIIFFILLIISLYFFIFSHVVVLKKTGFIAGLLFLMFTILTNVFAMQQKDALLNRDSAIVMNPSVTIRSTPNDSGTTLFILHEGSKVTIKDNSMKEWKEIRLEDGKVGWLPASSIEII
ncbi:tetratricopeptide repeat protein [Bacteroides sp.]|uniref:tetratricopeptide repeat protein n=1 Tax=Bacteroides sp. TaxID=29523 RepID=UPI001B7B6E27|nr:tetratricopeptide repeat protein [Bacteroides sp.]MBP6064757.1 tetratricopeptide repeat protein [Bacteroides sp.]MBP6066775.1 tetratricopeptide repeat protein [Bacteroides sp.]MBP6936354.1 tetratricopeptide repeat protein [Bacteroides sp.]MBP8621721.1 tetratricopeptide repeat protein [Bacteroides sp.]MBP9586213.1 tetratricopeptide repeat protein [Bacteroides sp.]